MALIIADRVKETTLTTGTGSITLTGAFGGFQTFSDAIGNGNKTYYVIESSSDWEIGIGTYTSSSNTLSRDTILQSSNSDNKIDLSGVSIVFCSYPADRTVVKNTANELVLSEPMITSKTVDIENDLGVSGILTMRRTAVGSFFHAYVDDSNDETIALYHDGTSSPDWRLGLKDSPSDSGAPPTYAYVYASDGTAGLYSNSQNSINLTHGGGFNVMNKGNTLFSADSDTGFIVTSFTAAQPVLKVKGAVSQAGNLQQWLNSSDSAVASIDADGDLIAKTITVTDGYGAGSGLAFFNTAGNLVSNTGLVYNSTNGRLGIGTASPDYALDVAGNIGLNEYLRHNGDTNTYIRFRGDQIDFVAGGRTMLTLDETSQDRVIVNNGQADVDFRVEGDGDANLIYTVASKDMVGIGTDDPIFKLDVQGGNALLRSSGVIVGNSGLVLADNAPSVTTNTLYNNSSVLYFNGARVDAAVSGWTKGTIDAIPNASLISGVLNDKIIATSGWALQTIGNSGVAVSGWVTNTIHNTGVAISGWATNTGVLISGWVAGNTFGYASDILANSASGVAISGWAQNTIINSGVSVSGWAATTITNEIAALVDSAPATLNTLNEIAAAINDDANIATTLTNSITANTTEVRANSASGVAISGYAAGSFGLASNVLANSASGTAISGWASNSFAGSAPILANSASGAVISGIANANKNTINASGDYWLGEIRSNSASGVVISGIANSNTTAINASGDFLLNEIRANSASGTTEAIQDIAGALVATGGTKTGISISYEDGTGDMDFVVDHDAASNFVANEHINHTSVTLTAGNGLTGGGDISSNRSFAVAAGSGIVSDPNGVHAQISGANLLATNAIVDNYVPSYDAATGKFTWVEAGGMTNFILEDGDGTEVTVSNGKEVKFVEGAGIDIDWTDVSDGSDSDPYDLTFTVDHDAASNFVANEHINHTSVTLTAGNGLTGGGDISSSRSFAVTAGSGVVSDPNGVHAQVSGANLLATNTPTDNYIPSYDIATGKFTWVENAGGGGGGSMTTVKANNSQVGGADIVTLDFSTDFTVSESPDTEINVSLATGNPSGVSFFGGDAARGILTSSSEFLFNSGNCELHLNQDGSFVQFAGSDNNKALKIGNSADTGTNAGKIWFYLNNSTVATMIVGSAGLVTELNNTDDMMKFRDGNNDDVFIIEGGDEAYNTLTTAGGATKIPHVIKGASAQSANLQEWRSNADTTVAHVGSDGSIATSGTLGASGDITANADINLIGNLELGGYINDGSLVQVRIGGSPKMQVQSSNVELRGPFLRFADSSGNDKVTLSYSDTDILAVKSDDNSDLASILASGASVSGVELLNHVPASTTNRLYNEGGTLKFNGSAVGGGGMSNFILEDGDGTEVTVGDGKEVKFVEGAGIDIDWTDVSNGSDGDPYDLTFTVDHDAADNFVANEHINHTSVTLSAGDGLSGGGDISANRSFAVDAAQTTITSIYNTSLAIGYGSSHANIDFSTDNRITFDIDGTSQMVLLDGVLRPTTDSDVDLGSSAKYFKTGYFDDLDLSTMNPSGLSFFAGDANRGKLTSISELVIESGQNRLYQWPKGGSAELVKLGWNAAGDEYLINTVANGGTARNVSLAVGGTSVLTLNAANSRMVIAGDMYPDNDAGRELGSSTKRWENIYTDQLNAHCHTASDICIQVKAHSSQSANVQSWRTNGGTEFVGIGPDGGIVLPDNTPSSTTNKLYNNGGTLTFNGSAIGGSSGMTNFILEDDSGDEVSISDGEEVKFIGDGVTINWTDTSDGSDGDPFDLTFTLDTVPVSKGGTNATALDDKAVLITQDSGTDTVSAAVMDANGELLIGGTSGPAVATLTQGSNMTITNADGGITLASSGGAGISDEDLKENVEDLDIDALDKVDELRPVEFDWNQAAYDEFNEMSGHDIGLIAQEVEQVFPEFISEFRGRKTVDYPKLTVILLKAVQELRQEVENLKSTPN